MTDEKMETLLDILVDVYEFGKTRGFGKKAARVMIHSALLRYGEFAGEPKPAEPVKIHPCVGSPDCVLQDQVTGELEFGDQVIWADCRSTPGAIKLKRVVVTSRPVQGSVAVCELKDYSKEKLVHLGSIFRVAKVTDIVDFLELADQMQRCLREDLVATATSRRDAIASTLRQFMEVQMWEKPAARFGVDVPRDVTSASQTLA